MKEVLDQAQVDIILPNYNSALFVSETIDSVINQSFKNWNLIIVDGNSNEDTKKVLKKYKDYSNISIIWLKKNKKAGFCRNLALRNSKSDYVAFIDSDDIWEKNKLQNQLSFMIKNQYSFTYTNYRTFTLTNEKKNLKEIKPPQYFTFKKFTKNTSISTCTMILKRSAIGNVKFSNTKICEDYFFKCQILKKGKNAYCLPKIMTKYRISNESLQSNKFRNLFWIWIINKKYNKFGFFKNLISLFSISINSIIKYGILR